MDELKCVEIVGAIGGRPERREKKIKGVSTDSRIISPGELFVALKGDNFDGHDFVEKALEKGAVGAVVSEDIPASLTSREQDRADDHGHLYRDKFILRVDDTLKALGDIAKYYRRKLPTKIVGVTGSNGKTTTKEMISHALSRAATVARSQKSFNNFVGVPLTIFDIESRHRYAVIEMGANAPGEIRRLAEIAQPDVGVITNISETHLLGLKSVEGVAKAKAELVEALDEEGAAVLNNDDEWCKKIASQCRCRLVTYGLSEGADVRASDISRRPGGISFTLSMPEANQHEIHLPVRGLHNVHNALAAIAACQALACIGALKTSVWQDLLPKAFSDFHLPSMRLEQCSIGTISVINDAYNANYRSMLAAIDEFSFTPSNGRKIFVCGDMLELGQYSRTLHEKVGAEIAKSKIDVLWTVGDQAKYIAESAQAQGMPAASVFHSPTVNQAAESIPAFLEDHDTLLIKGSRGMTMEHIIEAIRNR